ncbi:carbohydrate ABC transporter permease [Streptomyces sp. NPDC048590]|uniref:carbohydrate ABC transporter permease n=1 Tax=Streptomyces sp. NPDC048590 TaxID=3365574 RepID=UPI00371F9484
MTILGLEAGEAGPDHSPRSSDLAPRGRLSGLRGVGRPSRPGASRRAEGRAAATFLTVPVLAFIVFTALPIALMMYYSFTEYDVLTAPKWVGLANYTKLFDDPFFYTALKNTAIYTLMYVPLGIVVSLATALLLNRKVRASRYFRVLFYVPVISSTVATASIWYWMLNPQHGLVNIMLGWFGIDGPAWLYSSTWAMPAIVLMSVWAGFGTNMVIYLAGLQNIPPELAEAARTDGANGWQVFRHVTLPSLSRTTLLVTTLQIISAFQVFDQAYVLTKGGPGNSTVTLVYYIYDRGFAALQMGYASAISVVLFVVILVVSLLNARIVNRTGDR